MVQYGRSRESPEDLLLPLVNLALLQVYGRGLATIAALELEADLLTFVQIADAGPLNRRNMNEYIL
jgi:hypothetical protein